MFKLHELQIPLPQTGANCFSEMGARLGRASLGERQEHVHLLSEEIEVQRRNATCLGSHSTKEALRGFVVVAVLLCFVLSQIGSVAQAGGELKILLSQSPKCWDYRHESPSPGSLWVFVVDCF
jgi:hypothetical protein